MFKSRYVTWSSLVALIACGCQNPEAHWAVQHAEVFRGDDTLSGYQTWEFYSRPWRRNHDEKHHICARVQAIEGVRVDSFLGCEGCDEVYALTVTEFSTDCEGDIATQHAFEATTHFGLGTASEELLEYSPDEEIEFGWYVSWDSVELQELGYAWPNEVDNESSDTGNSDPFTTGDGLVLWPGYAWEL